jgi:hypothetical protein
MQTEDSDHANLHVMLIGSVTIHRSRFIIYNSQYFIPFLLTPCKLPNRTYAVTFVAVIPAFIDIM